MAKRPTFKNMKQEALSKALLNTAATGILKGTIKPPKFKEEAEVEVIASHGKNLKQV